MILPSKDPEVLKKALTKWRKKNREKIRIKQREDYAKNPEKFKKIREKYRANNREKIKKYEKEYRANNRGKRNKLGRDYYIKNREKMKKYSAERRKKNRDEINRKQNEWRKKNIEYVRKERRKWQEKNREKIRIGQREDYAKNPERYIRYRKKHEVRIKKLLLDRKMSVFSVYSKRFSNSKIPCCACCRENYSHEFLAIDHINGRKIHGHSLSFGGQALYRWLAKNDYPEGFQVLCHNCNMSKGAHRLCIHKRSKS